MSFLIAVYVNEGVVLASDRRTTYSNTQIDGNKTTQRIGIHVTNSTDKTFVCPNGAGLSCCGESSLLGKPIAGYLKDMIRTEIGGDCSIESMPQIIINYFSKLPEVPDTHFIIAGYDNEAEKKKQRVIRFGLRNTHVESIDTSSQGAIWDGETNTLTRLIQRVSVKTGDDKYVDMPFEDILWNYFTLQDAIDFARYAVDTTIQTMRFKNVVETVGGGIDILVITPDETKWLNKESLH